MSIALKDLTAFKIGGEPAFFASVKDHEDLEAVVRMVDDLPIVALGGGTNVVFPSGKVNCAVIRIENKGRSFTEKGSTVELTVAAGENWDEIVLWSIQNGWSGIEALSGIPGTVGATPVQNVGAYGREISDVFISVDVYDLNTRRFVTLSREECNFSYRDSVFKGSERGRFIIFSVKLRLSTEKPTPPTYESVKRFFEGRDDVTLKEIRESILTVRRDRLPSPDRIPNMGSFFKNPIVEQSKVGALLLRYPEMPHYPTSDGRSKLFAGWFIEKLGLKGAQLGNIEIYEKNALVLVNRGADFNELIRVKEEIEGRVSEEFGITLEIEPQIMCS